MDALIAASQLAARLNHPDLRVFDVTVHLEGPRAGVRSGREDYEQGHVPGAGFLAVLTDLSDPSGKLLFTRPTAGQLEATLSRNGVSNGHDVVFYSAASPIWATRAWWLLRAAGHERVAVLDGGFARWRAEGHPVSAEPFRHPPARFEADPREALWASQQDVLAAMEDGGACTLDALPTPLYRGNANLGYARAGHIRGALSVPFSDLLDPETGLFRPPEQLRQRFADAGVLARERVISYCGGAIAASLNAFALTLLGHENVAVYDGSLDEWSRDPDLPMETG